MAPGSVLLWGRKGPCRKPYDNGTRHNHHSHVNSFAGEFGYSSDPDLNTVEGALSKQFGYGGTWPQA